MVKLLVKSNIKPGYLEKVAPLYKELIEESLKEKGCLEYCLFSDTTDEHAFYMIETWESAEDLEAHKVSAHVKRLVPLIMECRVSPAEIIFLKEF